VQRSRESQERLSLYDANQRSMQQLSSTVLSLSHTIEVYSPSPKMAPKATPREQISKEMKKKKTVNESFGYLNQVLQKKRESNSPTLPPYPKCFSYRKEKQIE
jgi:hypothetical protein